MVTYLLAHPLAAASILATDPQQKQTTWIGFTKTAFRFFAGSLAIFSTTSQSTSQFGAIILKYPIQEGALDER